MSSNIFFVTCVLHTNLAGPHHFDNLKLPKNISDIVRKKPKSSEIISAMKLDKKTINNIINFILAKGIGKAFKCATVKEKALRLFLDENISL